METKLGAKQFIEEFFGECIEEQNYDKLIARLDKEIVWIGTEEDEICNSYEEVCHLLAKKICGIYQYIRIQNKVFHQKKISKGTFYVWGALTLEIKFGQKYLVFKEVRISAICKVEKEIMKIVHMHASMPTKGQIDLKCYEKQADCSNLVFINKLCDEIKDQCINVLESNKELSESNYELKKRINEDSLTGLLNHSHILKTLELEIEKCKINKLPLAVMMLDIDYFKAVNDTYGHIAGDEVIVGIAALLREKVGKLGYISRYGGEEFFIVLPNINLEKASRLAEGIRLETEERLFTDCQIRITLSIGICEAYSGCNVKSLVKLSDELLYFAKNTGRNKVCIEGAIKDEYNEAKNNQYTKV